MNALSPQQFQELADARQRAAKIRRAIGVAKFDGWSVAIFAAVTLLGAIFSWWGVFLGVGMAIVAYVEFQGAARLRRLDPAAAKMLAINQVFLGLLLLSYATYSLWTVSHQTDEIGSRLASSPELASAMVNVQGLAKRIGYLIYGTLAAVAIFVQGGTALFYLSRRKYIERYRQETPQWIVQAQQAGLPM